jgi:hypothetical protein
VLLLILALSLARQRSLSSEIDRVTRVSTSLSFHKSPYLSIEDMLLARRISADIPTHQRIFFPHHDSHYFYAVLSANLRSMLANGSTVCTVPYVVSFGASSYVL